MITDYLKYHLNPSKDYERLEYLVSDIEEQPLRTLNNVLQRMAWVGVRDGTYGLLFGLGYVAMKENANEVLPQLSMLTGTTYGLSRMMYHHIKLMRDRK